MQRPATTDKQGKFSFSGLVPGSYYIEASPKEAGIVTHPPPLKKKRPPVMDYGRIYYPGASDVAGAIPVIIQAGAELGPLVLVPPKTETFPIRVTLIDPGVISAKTAVCLTGDSVSQRRVATVASNRPFEIRNVPPGSYRLQAWTSSGEKGRYRFAETMLTVTDSPLDDVKLVLHPGVPVSGKIVSDPRPPESTPRKVRVTLQPRYRFRFQTERLTTSVVVPGTFTFASVVPGDYRLVVSGLPPAYYVKQVSLNGYDVSRGLLSLGAAMAPDRLTLTVSPLAASVSGIVKDDRERPVWGATVVLFDQDQALDAATIRNQDTDQNGRFEFTGVAPGRYRLLAFTGLAYGEGRDPRLIQTYPDKGISIEVSQRQARQVSLTSIEIPASFAY